MRSGGLELNPKKVPPFRIFHQQKKTIANFTKLLHILSSEYKFTHSQQQHYKGPLFSHVDLIAGSSSLVHQFSECSSSSSIVRRSYVQFNAQWQQDTFHELYILRVVGSVPFRFIRAIPTPWQRDWAGSRRWKFLITDHVRRFYQVV